MVIINSIKTQLSKIIQSGGFLSRILSLLLNSGLPLTKNVIKPLTKSVLIPLELTAIASTANAGIHKKILGFGYNKTTLIISNHEMEDIIKIVKSLEDSGLLLKGVSETVQNEAKEQKKRISYHVIRYIRCNFIRKYFSW